MPIIGINGRIGSGKDTVAKMIQRIECIKLVEDGQLSSQMIPSIYSLDKVSYFPSKWQIKKFAGKLKEIASMLTGIPVYNFEDQEFKKTELGLEWDGITVREFLQRLGTEAIRDGLHKNTWVNALFSDYKIKREKVEDEEYAEVEPCWIISDMRFENEFNGVKEHGGFTVKIHRGNELLNDPKLHPSETSLDNHFSIGKFDYVINNNGTLEDLEKEVAKMLHHFKLL